MPNQRDISIILLCLCVYGETSSALGKRQFHHHTDPPVTTSPPRGDALDQWLAAAADTRPNVLLLIADDLRPRLGCYGVANIITPNIDSLASKSVLFTRAYSQFASCSPSRTSFLTGRRPDTTRVFDLHTYWRDVAGNFTTLPQHFKDHGYVTQGVGKVFHPGQGSGDNDKGFSWSRPYYTGNQPIVGNKERHKAAYRSVNTSSLTGKLRDTDVADYAVAFLREHSNTRDDPFFLAVGFTKPHLPFIFPKEYADLYPTMDLAKQRRRPAGVPDMAWSTSGELRAFQDVKAQNASGPDMVLPDDFQKTLRRGYSASTSYMDAQLGRVLEALSANNFSKNTVIAFLGDHGWHLGDNAEWAKHTNYETALRIPLLIHVPGVTAGKNRHHFKFIDALSQDFNVTAKPPVSGHGHASDDLVEAVDLFPTIAALAALPVPKTCPLHSNRVSTCVEGTSLLPLVRQVRGLSPPSNMTWKRAAYSQLLRGNKMGYTLRTDTHRYTAWLRYHAKQPRRSPDWMHQVGHELYEHVADPDETHNLADVTSQQLTVTRMARQLRAGWRDTQAQYLASVKN